MRNVLFLLLLIINYAYGQIPAGIPDRINSASQLFDNQVQANNLLDQNSGLGDDFLPVNEAFRFSVVQQSSTNITLRFIAAEGYYLYKPQFAFTFTPRNITTKQVNFPTGITKNDEYFGEVEVFYEITDIDLELDNPAHEPFRLDVRYQGCADAGLCYPPEVVSFNFGLSDDHQSAANKSGLSIWDLLAFLVAGIGLSFTPCVLPMLPIISMLVIRNQVNNLRKFYLALSYVLAMAFCFAVLGALMGIFGANLNLQGHLQSPFVLVPFALFFVLMAAAMFGLFELQLPSLVTNFLHARMNNTQGGSITGAAVLGILSSLLVSPCVSAPLVAVLVYISTSGDAVGGFSKLLALGLGMGIPLIIFSVGGGFLLPKSGNWLITVRDVFGVLLLAVAVWLLERVIPVGFVLPLWSLFTAISAFILLRGFNQSLRLGKCLKALAAFILLLYSLLALVGAFRGGSDPLRPLTGRLVIGSWQNFTDVQGFELALKQAAGSHTSVVVDFYADWCISCKIMEREVFAHEQIRSQLDNHLLLRFDVTKADASQKALLQSLGLFGPPAILFFANDGKRLHDLDIIGEVNYRQFQQYLDDFASYLQDH